VVTLWKVLDELLEKIPDFRRTYEEDGLNRGEFAEFGPVDEYIKVRKLPNLTPQSIAE
jgi:hypothetical protein